VNGYPLLFVAGFIGMNNRLLLNVGFEFFYGLF
jgi:hypothetical protein